VFFRHRPNDVFYDGARVTLGSLNELSYYDAHAGRHSLIYSFGRGEVYVVEIFIDKPLDSAILKIDHGKVVGEPRTTVQRL